VAKLYAAFHDLAAGPTREIHSTDEISFPPLPLAGVRAAVRRSLRHGACVPPNNLFDDHLRTTGWELEMPVPEPDVMTVRLRQSSISPLLKKIARAAAAASASAPLDGGQEKLVRY
jgi:hypothetical protein